MIATRNACGAGEFAVICDATILFCTVNSGENADADRVVFQINTEAQTAYQRCLDIVNGNYDARKPTDDLTEIIARIVTDIQSLP